MDDSYQAGFAQGWKAIRGGAAAVPGHATYAPTKGRTPFQEGIRRAVKKALQREGFDEVADEI
jgi:hypothetical protein